MGERVIRTGLNALKARVKIKGLSVIDMRTLAAQDLVAWKESLIRDLGGEEAISTSERTIVELAVRSKLLVDHVDAFLLSQESLVHKRRRQIYPIVRERQRLVDSLAHLLGQLGLAKREPPMRTLVELLNPQKGGSDEHSRPDEQSEDLREDVRTEEEAAPETD